MCETRSACRGSCFCLDECVISRFGQACFTSWPPGRNYSQLGTGRHRPNLLAGVLANRFQISAAHDAVLVDVTPSTHGREGSEVGGVDNTVAGQIRTGLRIGMGGEVRGVDPAIAVTVDLPTPEGPEITTSSPRLRRVFFTINSR